MPELPVVPGVQEPSLSQTHFDFEKTQQSPILVNENDKAYQPYKKSRNPRKKLKSQRESTFDPSVKQKQVPDIRSNRNTISQSITPSAKIDETTSKSITETP